MKALFLFLVIAILTPYSIAIAEDYEKVIIISEKVGEVIDAQERAKFGLWPEIKGFKSTIFLQLSDGSYVAEVTYEENGEEKKARTPQSDMSIKSLKSYIEKVSKGEIQPASLTDVEKTEEEKYASYTKGELVSISGKVGASIDKNERNEYELFNNIPNFERATFYSIKEGGYLIEIQTVTDTLISVVSDTKMVSILADYVDRYEIIRLNRESFEKKWSIVSYDEQGIPITENEMLRYHKKVSCCALGCGLGGSALGLVTGAVLAVISSDDFDILHSTEKENKRIAVFAYTGITTGAIAGYFIGNSFDNKFAKGVTIREIKKLRTPK